MKSTVVYLEVYNILLLFRVIMKIMKKREKITSFMIYQKN